MRKRWRVIWRSLGSDLGARNEFGRGASFGAERIFAK
jgi:hypothetical protein